MKEIMVPMLPESVSDAVVATCHVAVGDMIEEDQNLVDLETDKVMLEVPAPCTGIVKEWCVAEGDVVTNDVVLLRVDDQADVSESPVASSEEKGSDQAPEQTTEQYSPAVRRLLDENSLDPSRIQATGKGGRLTAEDVKLYLKKGPEKSAPKAAAPASSQSLESAAVVSSGPREKRRVPMTRLRKRVAERLVEVKQTTAMLTTFNEVDMKPAMDLRARYKDMFEKTHGTRLGFMSFFVKAAVEALQRLPAVNAYIDGDDIVYHSYADVGVAVSSDRGLVVPVLRDAQDMGMADVEKQIRAYAAKARDGKLTLEEMTGGTFTITNGGVFGSMLSTPIINPPQSAILGMHNIVERPVVVDGEIVVRPIMYLALSYDHRLIDGKEAVTFLKIIKELLEDPARLILQV